MIRNWNTHAVSKPIVIGRGVKYRDVNKMALIPIKNVAIKREILLRRPEWMRIKLPADSTRIQGIKVAMRKNSLHPVCEEASCFNPTECSNHGTATFMILSTIRTRHCPFCDIAYGRPVAPDVNESVKLAQTTVDMVLRYAAITSADRDDLHDDGVQHLMGHTTIIREKSPQIKTEILVPDFHSRMDRVLDIPTVTPPDVFNHNLKNVPHIYHQVRPDVGYNWSLKLLERSKEAHPKIPTKFGPVVRLGETSEKIIEVMRDLRRHGVTMLTLGQYLQPGHHHPPVQRCVDPDEFDEVRAEALAMDFTHVAYGPSVRPSYHTGL